MTHIATEAGKTPSVLGKTEVVENNLNPQWAKHFAFDYDLGTPCRLAVSVFHHKKSGSSESMGAAIFDVGQVLGARGSTKAKQLKGNGQIYMTVRKAEPAGTFRFKFKGQKVRGESFDLESLCLTVVVVLYAFFSYPLCVCVRAVEKCRRHVSQI